MSGRSIGLASCHFSGLRVTGQLTYIPAHVNAQGKRINAKAEIPVALNTHKGTRHDGTKGSTSYFKLTAWGKLADIMCRSCPPGKAIDVYCEPRTYRGKLYDKDFNVRLDPAGQPIEITKTAFNIMSYPVFGEESEKQIQAEINARPHQIRPTNWNVVGHPDYAKWTAICQARQAYNWDGQSATFLFARVRIPQGVTLDFSQQQGQVVGQPTPPANQVPMQSMVNHVQQQLPQQQMNTPEQVQNAVNNVNAQIPQAPLADGGAGGFAPQAPVAPQMGPGANINTLV